MTIKFNFTKVGIIALTTELDGVFGTVFHGTEYGILAGLIVGVALEFEQVAIVDSSQSVQGGNGSQRVFSQ